MADRNLCSVTTSQEAIRALAKAMGEYRDRTGNLEPLPAVFRDQMASVVRTAPDAARELVMMRWVPPGLSASPAVSATHIVQKSSDSSRRFP